MKKVTTLIFVLLFVLLFSAPAMAIFGNIDIDVDACIKNTNTNVNKNLNDNKNLNINKAEQKQKQTQKQTANNEGVKQKVTFNEAETKREFLAPGEVKYGKLGTYKESSRHGPEFTSFVELTRYKKKYSYTHALKHYGKPYGRGKCITIGGSYNGRHEDDPSKVATVIEKVDMSTMEAIGFLTVKTNPKWHKKWFVPDSQKGVDSFIVLQKVVLSACIMKGKYIKLVAEGAETISWNSGHGVGFNVSGGIVNDMGNRGRSGSTSGGTGYSYGEAGNRTLPWVVVQVFKDK